MFLLNAPAQRIATALNALPRNLAVTINEAIKAKKFGSDEGAPCSHTCSKSRSSSVKF